MRQLPFKRHNLMMPFSPKQVAMPRTLEELVAVVQAAAVASEPMKSIGDGYGFANTGFTRGCLIPTEDGLNRILTVDREVLKAGVDADHLYKFESAATVELIGAHLWALGKAVINQPGYEKLTWVGTMSSAGHGSGTWCRPLSEHAPALHVVTLDKSRKVVQFQVEPGDDISDPARFAAKYPALELVQENDIFRACTVAMGCLGIIYSALPKSGTPTTLTKPGPSFHGRPSSRGFRNGSWIKGPGRPCTASKCGSIRTRSTARSPACSENGGKRRTRRAARGRSRSSMAVPNPSIALAWWSAHHPSAVPVLIDAAITATQARDVVMNAPKGLNFGALKLAAVTASACGVPLADIGNLVNALIAFFQARARGHRVLHDEPDRLAVREGATAHLSPAYGRDTSMIEIPTSLGTPRARDTLDRYDDFLFQNFNGRPHWGQVNDMPGDRLRVLYPKLDCFLESFRVLNPKGVFDNAFTEQMGLRNA